jgi:tRNA(Leu) C34 or U34 (ribose-2'-O)-methylase TrmL
VIFPTHRQAPLSPAAVKASAGAVEHLLLAPVDDLAAALADLHARGLRVVGAEADAPLTARQSDLRGPLAIVIGSEGQGLGPTVRRRADQLMRIPMHGQIESLNAAVAGSVLLFEAVAQRDPDGSRETARTPGVTRGLPEPRRGTGPRKAATEPSTEQADPAAAEPAADAATEPEPKRTRKPRVVAAAPAEAPAEEVDLLPGRPEEKAPSKPATRAKAGAKAKPATAAKSRTKAKGSAAAKPAASTKPSRSRTPHA